MSSIFGITLACAFPLVSLGLIRELDLYQTGQFKWILRSVGWGMFAYACASLINRGLVNLEILNRKEMIQYYAPVDEEILKALILLFLVKRFQLTYSFDGALYGFAVGIGFAIAENIGYILDGPGEAVAIAAQRILSANLVHASSSAILGIGLSMMFLGKTSVRWMAFAAGLFLAVSLHFFYNKTNLGGASLRAAIAIGLTSALFVYLAIELGKKQAQRWIKQQLGMEAHITRGEVTAVDQLASTDLVLHPVLERFGPEKASQVEKLLYLQAHLGLKRKALDNFQANETVHKALEVEIHAIREEIKTTYRAIGVYAMLFVRGLFTDEMVSVWDQVQERIREGGEQKAGGIWSSLDERLKTSMHLEGHE